MGKKTGLVMPLTICCGHTQRENASRVSTTCEAGLYELGHMLCLRGVPAKVGQRYPRKRRGRRAPPTTASVSDRKSQ